MSRKKPSCLTVRLRKICYWERPPRRQTNSGRRLNSRGWRRSLILWQEDGTLKLAPGARFSREVKGNVCLSRGQCYRIPQFFCWMNPLLHSMSHRSGKSTSTSLSIFPTIQFSSFHTACPPLHGQTESSFSTKV